MFAVYAETQSYDDPLSGLVVAERPEPQVPDGWVTGHGLTRSAALKCLGNGVVPQQATAALAAMAHNIERKPCAT